jgi:hypothetical protein
MNRKLDKKADYAARRKAALAELQAIEEEEAASDHEAAADDLAAAADDFDASEFGDSGDSGDSGAPVLEDSGEDSGVTVTPVDSGEPVTVGTAPVVDSGDDSGTPPAAIITDESGAPVEVPPSEPGAVGAVEDANGNVTVGELPVDATVPPVEGQPAEGADQTDAPATEDATPATGTEESSQAVAADAPVAEQLAIDPEAGEPVIGDTFQEEADAISEAAPDVADITVPPVEDVIPEGAPVDLTVAGDADAALPVTEPTGTGPDDTNTIVQETKDSAAAADEDLQAQPDGTGPIA